MSGEASQFTFYSVFSLLRPVLRQRVVLASCRPLYKMRSSLMRPHTNFQLKRVNIEQDVDFLPLHSQAGTTLLQVTQMTAPVPMAAVDGAEEVALLHPDATTGALVALTAGQSKTTVVMTADVNHVASESILLSSCVL